MNMNKYIIIIAVAIFAAAAISAFGAVSGATSANAGTTAPVITLSDAVSRLNSPSRAAVAGAVRDIARMQTEDAAQALIGFVKTSKDDYMRIQVIEILAVNPSTSTAPALVEAARDSNPYVRMAAVKSLGFRTDTESLPALNIALSQDKDIRVQKFALQSLGLHISSASVAMADNVLSNKSVHRSLRIIAARSLRKINTPFATSALAKYKNDTDPAVKNEANSGQAVTQTNLTQTKQKKGK